MMKEKKKHIANRHPADALNDGIRFDETLKAKKEAQDAKNKKAAKASGNKTSKEK